MSHNKKEILKAATSVFAVIVVALLAMNTMFNSKRFYVKAGNNNQPSHKVDICHHNNGNGWTSNNEDDHSVDGVNPGNSDSDHNRGDHQDGQDIIPPFYDDGAAGYWAPRNWDATGQAIWNNNCNIPGTTVSPTVTLSPVPTNVPSATPTDVPTATVTPTEVPSATPTPTTGSNASPTPTDTQSLGGNSNSPTVTPIPTGSVQSSNNSNSDDPDEGQVLGASAMADTGDNTNFFFMLGLVLASTSLYGLSLAYIKKENN